MESAFAWLGHLIEWLGRWIPKIVVVRATHGGVKFVNGWKVKRLNPGRHIYWPIFTDIEIIPVARQSMNLITQILVTADNQTVSCGAVIVYDIVDVVKALSQNWDITDTINDITQTAIVETITTTAYDDIKSDINCKIVQRLTKSVRDALKPYGIKVHRCSLSDFGPCLAIKLLGEK